jgi:hypothetical protein
MRSENPPDTVEELITIIGELIASMDRAVETLFEETQRQDSLLRTKDRDHDTSR